MLVMFSLLCLIMALIGWLFYRFAFNPISSMFFLWAVIVPLSGLGLYGTMIPQEKAYWIIAIGLIAYTAGVVFGSKKIRLSLRPRYDQCAVVGYRVNYRFLNIIIIISLLYYLVQSYNVARVLLSGKTYADIRAMVAANEENALRSSRLMSVTRAFIAVPTTYLAIAILPIEIFYGKKNKLFILESLLLMVLFVFTNGARSVILWIAIYFVCVYLAYRKKHSFSFKIGKKYKRIIILGGILLFIMLFYMTIFRKGRNVDFGRQLFVYFIAPIPHFSHYIDVVDYSGQFGYGISSFYGFLYPFLYFFKLLTGYFSSFVTDIYYMSFEMMEPGFNLGHELYMNAFVTIFYQPYLDGRFVGVVLILMVFGYMCSQTYKKGIEDENLKSMLLYLLLLQKILFSFVRFYFTQQAQAMCFIFALFAISRVYKYREIR